jgi:hypothetical protein
MARLRQSGNSVRQTAEANWLQLADGKWYTYEKNILLAGVISKDELVGAKQEDE